MIPSGMGVWSVSRRMQRTESSVGMPGLDTVQKADEAHRNDTDEKAVETHGVDTDA